MSNTATRSSLSCPPGQLLYSTAVQLLLHWHLGTRVGCQAAKGKILYMCYPGACSCLRPLSLQLGSDAILDAQEVGLPLLDPLELCGDVRVQLVGV